VAALASSQARKLAASGKKVGAVTALLMPPHRGDGEGIA
jgi:hypothetical protein